MRQTTDGGIAARTETGLVAWILVIAAVLLLIPVVALWLEDEHDRMHPKQR